MEEFVDKLREALAPRYTLSDTGIQKSALGEESYWFRIECEGVTKYAATLPPLPSSTDDAVCQIKIAFGH